MQQTPTRPRLLDGYLTRRELAIELNRHEKQLNVGKTSPTGFIHAARRAAALQNRERDALAG